ncbi:hypothetical protein KY363_05960 [Candidatus Woesearchaeota archaeon]|nr:hypothetical protein [Candidatus Woesearchaeota archaeon]
MVTAPEAHSAKSVKEMIHNETPAAGKTRKDSSAKKGLGSVTADVAKAAPEGSVAHATHAKEKKTCKACSVSEPLGCPLCSTESLVLIAVAIVMISVGYTWSRYLAWAALLLAFLVPMIKKHFKR